MYWCSLKYKLLEFANYATQFAVSAANQYEAGRRHVSWIVRMMN